MDVYRPDYKLGEIKFHCSKCYSTMLPKDVLSAKTYSPQARISIKFEPFANMVKTNLTVL